MDSLFQDIRFSARTLWKSPAFSVIAIITLALGIGATTAMFSVINQTLLAPLPYDHPEQIVHIHWASTKFGVVDSLNGQQVRYVAQNSKSFSATAAKFYAPGCNLVSGGDAQYVSQASVSPDFFRTFSVQPELGRTFVADDALAQPAQVAVITDQLWRGRLGGDANIIGKTIKCNGLSYTVIGILPKTFHYVEEPADVWIPDRIENYVKDNGSNYWMVGRLRDGVTVAQAQQELTAMSPQFHKDFPQFAWDDWIGKDGHWEIKPLQEFRIGEQKQSLLLLFGAVSLVLLIAAANVAGLILARASGRSRELATRLALGATRARLVRQMLTETVLLALAGGIASLVLASWTVSLLAPLAPEGMIADGAHLDGAMLSFAIAVSVIAGLLAGIVPALRSTRGDIYIALKQGDRSASGTHSRLRKALVTSEVALALLLLVGSTLLVRSFMLLQNVSPGVEPTGVTVAYMSLGAPKFQKTAAVAQFQRDVLHRVSVIPGVTSAATITAVPMRRDLNLGAIFGTCTSGAAVQYRAVSPGYFATMGIPFLRGRGFTDSESQPVAIVNERFAQSRCWSGKEALGQQIWIGKGMGDAQRQILGVVGNTHDFGPASPPTPTVYVPQWQVPDQVSKYGNGIFYWSVVTRSAPGAAGLGESIQRAIRDADPEQPVVAVVPLSQIIGNWLSDSRRMMQLMTAFAGLALLLTAIGLYGVLSYYVTQRTREIGIRMALGASRTHLIGSIIREGLVLVGIGAVIGTAGAIASARLLKSLLFGVKANDPVMYLTATLFLVATSLLASYLPARRASRVDPVIALRYE